MTSLHPPNLLIISAWAFNRHDMLTCLKEIRKQSPPWNFTILSTKTIIEEEAGNRSREQVPRFTAIPLSDFSPTSSGTIHYQDKAGFDTDYSATKDRINLIVGNGSLQIVHPVEVPMTLNMYEYRISSSAPTANPWRLNRVDYNLTDLGIGKA